MRNLPGWMVLSLSVLWIILAGCRSQVHIQPKVRTEKLAQTGYVIQVGAFSVLDNAVRMAGLLEKQGLDPYYFKHESGLYKVRFGDFSSRKKAFVRAVELFQEDIIKDYYIVEPEEHPSVKAAAYGADYLRENIVLSAESFLGIKYAWGGISPEDGFDCSGLTMTVYRLNGFNLPRNSRIQFRKGEAVQRSDLRKGDLVFFSTTNSSRKVSHVGIYVGDGCFIHAPGRNARIRKDRLEQSYYRKCFVGARRYLIP
jgi:hypothetical protein